MTRALGVALTVAALLTASAEPDRIEFGRFGAVMLYRDRPTPTQVVLLFSGSGGWDSSMAGVAQALAQRDALVLGIDSARYTRALSGSSDPCDYPAGELEALSQFAQKKLARPSYSVPFLVGVSMGAALAFAALAQAPPDTFRAGLASDFRAELALARPLCQGHGLVSQTAHDRNATALSLAPGQELVWVSIDGGPDLPRRLAASFSELAARTDPPRRELAADVSDLPLVEVAPTGAPSDSLAVVVSGDGGWASLDREVGGVLAAHGVPVVGFDSLQYFWTRRTPDESGRALERVLRFALAKWPGGRIALIGYSRGADVLPFMASRLPADLRARVALVALLAPGVDAAFEFHLTDWLGGSAARDALPTAPEAEKLRGLRVLCVYGREESESLCRKLDAGLAVRDERPGAHHFDGDYAAIGAAILEQLSR